MRRVKMAAIGIGRLGSVHARNIANRIPQAELIAVCARTLSTAQKLQRELAVPYAYDDFEACIANPDLEAVCITTYTRFHPEQILKSLERGLAVFCDKPIAHNYTASKAVVETIQSKYKASICMIGFMKRYDPSYVFVKSQIEAGKLGRPILFRGYGADTKHISQSTLAYLSESQGLFYDFFVHDFDLSRWLIGSDWRPETVKALGGVYLFEECKQHNDFDNATCLAQFRNGAMGFYYCGRTTPHGYLMETEIIGTEAIMRIGTTPSKNLVQVIDERGFVKEEQHMFLDRFETAYYLELQEFVDCILEKRQPEVTVEDALKAAEMALLATAAVGS